MADGIENAALVSVSTLLHQVLEQRFGKDLAKALGVRVYFKNNVDRNAKTKIVSGIFAKISQTLVDENDPSDATTNAGVNSGDSSSNLRGKSRSSRNRRPSKGNNSSSSSGGLPRTSSHSAFADCGNPSGQTIPPPSSTPKERQPRKRYDGSSKQSYTEDLSGGLRKLNDVVNDHNPCGRYGVASDVDVLHRYGLTRDGTIFKVRVVDVFKLALILKQQTVVSVTRRVLSILLGNRKTASFMLDFIIKPYFLDLLEALGDMEISIPKIIQSSTEDPPEFVFVRLQSVEDSKRWADICADIDDDASSASPEPSL